MTFARNFQKHFGDKGMIIYIKSEGRLSPEMIERVGIDTDPNKFFCFDCNIFEKVFELIRELVFQNEDDKRYMFIIDSVDALCRVGDIDKPFAESEQVAGGALITSVFLKKDGLTDYQNGAHNDSYEPGSCRSCNQSICCSWWTKSKTSRRKCNQALRKLYS